MGCSSYIWVSSALWDVQENSHHVWRGSLSHEALSSALLAPHPWPWGQMAYGQSFSHPSHAHTLFQLTSRPLKGPQVLVLFLPALTPKGLAPSRGP